MGMVFLLHFGVMAVMLIPIEKPFSRMQNSIMMFHIINRSMKGVGM